MVMARKKETKEKDIIGQLLDNTGFRGLTQNEVVGQDGLIKQLTGRILQRALEAEMTEHLGYEKNPAPGTTAGTAETDTLKRRFCLRTKVRLLKFQGTGTGRLNQ
jgi:transposase-like protein